MVLYIVKGGIDMCGGGFIPHSYKMHNQYDWAVLMVMDICSKHDNCYQRKKLFFTNHDYGIWMIFVHNPKPGGGG